MLRLESLSYFRKWVAIGSIIGVIAGFGSLAIYYSILFFSNLFMSYIVGYQQPVPVGEGGSLIYSFFASNYYWIPIIVVVGALLSGFLVYKFAPDAEGHGTDAVIEAFHNKNGKVSLKSAIVKLFSSAILIGSGGSAGREGPTAQITAGFASFASKYLHLTHDDRRLITAVAVGAGIGTIFRAPFGGALLGAEVMYRHDLETEAIFPGMIASAIGFFVFGAFAGYSPIFGSLVYSFGINVFPFVVLLGLISGVFARLYVKVFYKVHNAFEVLKVSRYFRPAIGAVAVGAMALIFPEVLGVGYGWVQFLASGQLTSFTLTFGLPLAVFFFVLAIAKMVATAFSVGSGGSGGVFAPGMMIGASVGAGTALFLNMLFPMSVPTSDIGPFAIIGMLAFFGAAGKVPISVSLMVTEMTGDLALLPAAMVGIAIAFIVSGRDTIYRSQVDTKRDSPAHIGDYYTPLLRRVTVKKSMLSDIAIRSDRTAETAMERMEKLGVSSLPVVRKGRLVGIIYSNDVAKFPRRSVTVRRVMKKSVKRIELGWTAETAWNVMIHNKASWGPVIEKGKYIGTVSMDSLLKEFKVHAEAHDLAM